MTERRCPDPIYSYEFICKVIEPTVKLSRLETWWEASWNDGMAGAGAWNTKQEAWQAVFQILDRRKAQP